MIDIEHQLRDALAQRAQATTLTRPPFRLRVTTPRRSTKMLLVMSLGAVTATVVGLVALSTHFSHPQGANNARTGWRMLPAAPIANREDPAAVWTGNQLLLWGGGTYNSSPSADGAAIDVTTEKWTLLPTAPLIARRDPISVWTGTEMIVWGGTDTGGVPLSDGAAYNPTNRTWRSIAQAPIGGTTSSFASMAWTGSEMIVWGGDDDHGQPRSNGAAYNPITDNWRKLAPSPLRARHEAATVWTGTEMILWGGSPAPGPGFTPFADGASYNPTTDTWRPVAAAPLEGRIAPAAWTGSEMIIAGGRTKDESPYIFGDGAAYDPTSDTWRKIAEGAGDSGLTNQAAWTGTALLTFAKGYGFAYDPTANTWKSLDRPAFSPSSSRVLWTGHDVLLIGTAALGTTPIGIVAAYRP